jgi:hypothetical protein
VCLINKRNNKRLVGTPAGLFLFTPPGLPPKGERIAGIAKKEYRIRKQCKKRKNSVKNTA